MGKGPNSVAPPQQNGKGLMKITDAEDTNFGRLPRLDHDRRNSTPPKNERS